jgi:hypothetical protein
VDVLLLSTISSFLDGKRSRHLARHATGDSFVALVVDDAEQRHASTLHDDVDRMVSSGSIPGNRVPPKPPSGS